MLKEFFTPPAPTFDIYTFNFDTDPARMDAYAAIYNTTSTDVGAFRQRGGKMLIVHGTSDPIFWPTTRSTTSRSSRRPTAATPRRGTSRGCSWCRA